MIQNPPYRLYLKLQNNTGYDNRLKWFNLAKLVNEGDGNNINQKNFTFRVRQQGVWNNLTENPIIDGIKKKRSDQGRYVDHLNFSSIGSAIEGDILFITACPKDTLENGICKKTSEQGNKTVALVRVTILTTQISCTCEPNKNIKD